MKVPSQFTPLFNTVVSQVGLTVAAVYGLIWRYSQMDEGVCCISADRMASLLAIDRRTVIRSIQVLKSGPEPYISDLTPTLLNRPHRYKPTSRIQCDIVSLPEQSTVSDCHTTGTLESQPGVTQSHSIKDLIDSKDINIQYIWESVIIYIFQLVPQGSPLSYKLPDMIPVSYINQILTVQIPISDFAWVRSRLTSIVNNSLKGLNPPGKINFIPYEK